MVIVRVAVPIALLITGLVAPSQAHAAVGDVRPVGLPAAGAAPQGITSGPLDAVWAAESQIERVARVNADLTVSELGLPGARGSGLWGIAAGSDGRLWVTERSGNRIGALNPSSGVYQPFALPNANAEPTGITAGPQGALWFTERAGNRIGRITTSGVIRLTSLPVPNAEPTDITAGSDGALWFTMTGANAIGRMTTGGVVSVFPVSTPDAQPTGITLGPDNNIWFTLRGSGSFARITPAGSITEFPLLTANSEPVGITSGPDGNLWIAQSATHRISRATPAGLVSEFVLPETAANPSGITAGSDGNVWFTSPATNQVYRVLTGVVPVNSAPPAISGPSTAVGQTLTASAGEWRFTPTTFTYEWQRCETTAATSCGAIAGGSAQTYVISAADTGKRLRVLVSATNTNGSSAGVGSPITAVDGTVPPQPRPTPVVGGQTVDLGNGVTATLRAFKNVRRGTSRSYAVVFNTSEVRGRVRIVLTNPRGREIRVIAKNRLIRGDRAVRTWVMPPRIKVRTVNVQATFTPAPDLRSTYPVATMSKPLRIRR